MRYLIILICALLLIGGHEGYSPNKYWDNNHYSIGFGTPFTGANFITKQEAVMQLMIQVHVALDDITRIFGNMPDVSPLRQGALIDMRFNLGATGFRSFQKMIKAVEDRDWAEVAKQAEDSLWYKQVGARGANIVHIFQFNIEKAGW